MEFLCFDTWKWYLWSWFTICPILLIDFDFACPPFERVQYLKYCCACRALMKLLVVLEIVGCNRYKNTFWDQMMMVAKKNRKVKKMLCVDRNVCWLHLSTFVWNFQFYVLKWVSSPYFLHHFLIFRHTCTGLLLFLI